MSASTETPTSTPHSWARTRLPKLLTTAGITLIGLGPVIVALGYVRSGGFIVCSLAFYLPIALLPWLPADEHQTRSFKLPYRAWAINTLAVLLFKWSILAMLAGGGWALSGHSTWWLGLLAIGGGASYQLYLLDQWHRRAREQPSDKFVQVCTQVILALLAVLSVAGLVGVLLEQTGVPTWPALAIPLLVAIAARIYQRLRRP